MNQVTVLVLLSVLTLASCQFLQTDLRFVGKVVVLTGGSTGIGRETAHRFASEGATVVFCARNATAGRLAETEINSDEKVQGAGGRTLYIQADVGHQDQVESLFQAAIDQFGRLDIVVANAGNSGWVGPIVDMPADLSFSDHDVMRTNYYGVLFATQQALRYWEGSNQTEGVIVNVASVAGLTGFPTAPLYGASKHAVIGLTKSVALQYRPNNSRGPRVRCNAVCPGFISTPIVWNAAKLIYKGEQYWEGDPVTEDDPLWTRYYEEVLKNTLPGGRIGEPIQVADVILFLSSDEASFMSGSIVKVDDTLVE